MQVINFQIPGDQTDQSQVIKLDRQLSRQLSRHLSISGGQQTEDDRQRHLSSARFLTTCKQKQTNQKRKSFEILDFLNSQKRLSRPLSTANWDKQEEPLKEEQEMEEEEEDEGEEVKRVFRPLQLLTACFGALRYLIQLLRFGKLHHLCFCFQPWFQWCWQLYRASCYRLVHLQVICYNLLFGR